uniref:ATP synthase F0 subunit 8 n=1 Tax=Aenasius arizonensis TaxID=2058190 RepID=A0A6B9XNP9_9HYME|nr:ATP synthase F0 subunit 8 [Aenasius arizonensis]QHR84893.1 ATP synthase F0 subunit 8 [Aenasius arizonensis]
MPHMMPMYWLFYMILVLLLFTMFMLMVFYMINFVVMGVKMKDLSSVFSFLKIKFVKKW